jgi:ankyrin repeat protein
MVRPIYFVYEKLDELKNLLYSGDTEEALVEATVTELITLLETEEFDPNERHDENYTILMEIAWTGRVDLVKVLVEMGADVNALSNDTTFALFEAAREGRQEVFDYLAPLTAPELREAAAEELAKGLLYRQRKDNKLVENFISAACNGEVQKLTEAISNGVDVNAIGSNGESALHKAVRNHQLLSVSTLLKAGAYPNIKDSDGETPIDLARAHQKKHPEILQAIVRALRDGQVGWLEE